MVHKRETLTAKERRAQETFMAQLVVKKRKTHTPFVIALVGLVGSGKSSVARELAATIGATIIEGDAIRVGLRAQSERYERARAIAEHAAIEVVKRGGTAILDSDFVDAKKRASIREKMRVLGARVVFIRTHSDFDVMIGRTISASYRARTSDFFGGASTKWVGSEQSRGAVVKAREMWRRTPHHYRWVNQGGGQWALKKLPFVLFAEVDTTDPNTWKRAVERCAIRLSKM